MLYGWLLILMLHLIILLLFFYLSIKNKIMVCKTSETSFCFPFVLINCNSNIYEIKNFRLFYKLKLKKNCVVTYLFYHEYFK